MGFGFAPVFPNVIATGAALFPRQVGAVSSAIIALGSVGGIVGPWLVGRALTLAGPRPAMIVVLGMTILMLGLFRLAGLPVGAGGRGAWGVGRGG